MYKSLKISCIVVSLFRGGYTKLRFCLEMRCRATEPSNQDVFLEPFIKVSPMCPMILESSKSANLFRREVNLKRIHSKKKFQIFDTWILPWIRVWFKIGKKLICDPQIINFISLYENYFLNARWALLFKYILKFQSNWYAILKYKLHLLHRSVMMYSIHLSICHIALSAQ